MKEDALDLALDATFQLVRFVEIAWGGLGNATEARKATLVLADYRNRNLPVGSPQHPTPEELEHAKKLEAFAAEQMPHFAFLHSLAAFRLWTILEVAVEDWLSELLQTHAELRVQPAFASLEGPLVDFVAMSVREQSRVLVECQKQRLSAPLKKGVGRFEALLNTVNLGGPVPDLQRRVLLEVAEVRNIVAHKNGRADSRFINQCPWFGANENSQLLVTHQHFQRYVTVAHWYLVELSRRYLTRYPEKQENPPKSLDERIDLLAVLEARLGPGA
jgi:hypothetical protein